ncbi:MAG: ankyrin repeat domain-containing protein [Azoarcus sp.]|nr:ankyrin repeat domain-containing protein [Azoarcus sp.]
MSVMCLGTVIFFVKRLLSKELFRFTHYPIRFNRKNRMVYVTRLDGTVMAESWDKLFFTEGVGGDSRDIRGHRLAEDGITVLETFALPIVTSTKNPYRFAFWEFVRRYMEDGPGKLMTRVEWTIDVSERREGFWQGFKFRYIDAASGIRDFAFILFPVILWYAAGRWIAMRTSKIPRWPAEVEAECQTESNDPYVIDEDHPPKKVDWFDDMGEDRLDDFGVSAAPPESLHDAVWNGKWGTAKRLLQQGAEVNQVNPEGKTPLDIARAHGDKLIINLLLTYGATDHQASQETPPK